MHILKDGNRYHFHNSLDIRDKLEPKNYLFDYDSMFGSCWIEDIEDFKFPEKIYDVSKDFRDMIRKSFTHYTKNQGVLLSGSKGQGKSLTAKLLCKELGVPVIIINKKIAANVNFVSFLNGIKQDYCLFIDEFEKLFGDSDPAKETEPLHTQNTFLSFMDGVLTNDHKILFLLTVNQGINDYFMNRPSRIKFLKEYDELDEEIFHMVAKDKLKNKDFLQDLEDNISLRNMNIDLLISIIDDINLYKKPFSSFKEYFNYREESYSYCLERVDEKSYDYEYISLGKRPRITDVYYGNYTVKEILKFEKSEIVFSTMKIIVDPKDVKKTIMAEIKMKVTPVKTHFGYGKNPDYESEM